MDDLKKRKFEKCSETGVRDYIIQVREKLNCLLQTLNSSWEKVCENRVAQALAEQYEERDMIAKETQETRMGEVE